uniref:Serpentine receptor class gamma n=1 Tax=Caenorhabditis tropicalis TaxID=1561998 RepID=A0A1I7TLE0_9PELO
MNFSQLSPNLLSISMENPTDPPIKLTIFQVIYGLVSIILMLVFIFLFSCSKEYSSRFYTVVRLDMIVNILCYLNTWLAIRLERFPSFIPLLKGLEARIPNSLTITKFLTTAA